MARLLTPEDRTKIYDYLADAYIELVRKKLIGPYERKVLSSKILEGVETSMSFEDLHVFISKLATTYTYFASAAVRVKAEIEKLQENKVIDQLQQYITHYVHK